MDFDYWLTFIILLPLFLYIIGGVLLLFYFKWRMREHVNFIEVERNNKKFVGFKRGFKAIVIMLSVFLFVIVVLLPTYKDLNAQDFDNYVVIIRFYFYGSMMLVLYASYKMLFRSFYRKYIKI